MTDFLNDLKADLLDRRLMPLVAFAVLALVGAVGWVVLASGSSSSSPSTSASSGSPVSTPVVRGIAVTPVSTENAVAETTSGTGAQHRGVAHNPFAPIPGVKLASTGAVAASTKGSTANSGSASSGSTSSSGSGKSSGSTESTGKSTTPSTKPAPEKKQKLYKVTALFGVLPPGAVAADVQLTPFPDMKLLTPLPNSKQPLIVYRGVTAKGRTAVFSVVGEVILHGQGTCLPSAAQCEAIDLEPGKAEQLEYLPATGPTVTYELRVVSISLGAATAASVQRYLKATSKAGHALLVQSERLTLPDLVQSPQPGVLVYPLKHAFTARAHAAKRHWHVG